MQSTKKYKVTVTEPAKDMLLEHADFLAQASLNATDRLLSRFGQIITRIADNPFQFPFADGSDVLGIPQNTYRKCLFEDRYKALFRLEESQAFIVMVIDTRMENTGLFQD